MRRTYMDSEFNENQIEVPDFFVVYGPNDETTDEELQLIEEVREEVIAAFHQTRPPVLYMPQGYRVEAIWAECPCDED